jgi:hypothetical protein
MLWYTTNQTLTSSRQRSVSTILVLFLVKESNQTQPLIFTHPACPVKKAELASIQTVISTASTLIQEDGDARTAPKAMAVLEKNMNRLKEAVSKTQSTRDDSGDFTFTYEEEADPEIFFIPYLWEVIVCVATASSIEWEKDRISVFPLLEEEEEEEETPAPTMGYSEDASDMV